LAGASIDTTTPAGKLIFGIFAALAEYERELIRERTMAGLASARAQGRAPQDDARQAENRYGGDETPGNADWELCRTRISRQTLYKHLTQGELRPLGQKLLDKRKL